jgi:hypothetical protein
VGQIAFPFVAVIMDPKAAGLKMLVAVRALHRLLKAKDSTTQEKKKKKLTGGS